MEQEVSDRNMALLDNIRKRRYKLKPGRCKVARDNKRKDQKKQISVRSRGVKKRK